LLSFGDGKSTFIVGLSGGAGLAPAAARRTAHHAVGVCNVNAELVRARGTLPRAGHHAGLWVRARTNQWNDFGQTEALFFGLESGRERLESESRQSDKAGCIGLVVTAGFFKTNQLRIVK
jgi:hypothetical protein